MGFLRLKNIAYNRIKKEVYNFSELDNFLIYWWSAKYSLPPNSPLVLERHTEELLLDYFVELLRDPQEQIKFEKEQQGQASIDEDEDWLKQAMGNEYKTEEQQIEDDRNLSDNNDKIKEEEFEDKYE